ncbi:TRAP transporter substrate-binding protein [Roseomonas xinghualingensis]|uniref:TRAP transporter substrate-binding protein n=1 Tax=Roseomonas xinghualingensis TaxID=2986475 RepID=UPI0021F1D139|nr:TRAP transporter substrate-binding protein [Roseomonas sp. SXEYE001]MCV4209565.1 TRAP transporter substrate-binding protein [Roseomonas sp. SXEYE001]
MRILKRIFHLILRSPRQIQGWRSARSLAVLVFPLILPLAGAAAQVVAPDTIRLQVVGGLAGVNQYTRLEEPFWRQRLPQITGGRLNADISPFDRSGIRGQETLRLLRLGVTPFSTALLGLVASEEPELSALELPGVSPDTATLRQVINAQRPWLEEMLRERHETELLAVYVYPAQVFFCARPFGSLLDLRGRRIRTSSAAQSEWVSALGAVPVVIPFAEIVPAIRANVVECAITGTLSGWQIGLNEVTTHIHAMALTWGVSLFGANHTAWQNLPPDMRDLLRSEVAELEQRIWEASSAETGLGLACTTGKPECTGEQTDVAGGRAQGRMTLVNVSPEDDALRRRLVRDVILPRWAERCGSGCGEEWNARIGNALGIAAPVSK